MSSVTDAPLADLYREADPGTVTAFVADLHEARGWAVEDRGDRRLVVSVPEERRRVGVVHPDDPPSPDLVGWADTVVAPEASAVPGNADVDVLDVAALHGQLAYALDRPVARELLRSHFGWRPPPEPDSDTPGSPSDDAAGDSGILSGLASQGVGRSQILLAAVLVVAVAGGVAVGVAGELGGERLDETAAGATAETPTPGPDTATPTRTAAVETPTPEGIASEIPTPVDGRYEGGYPVLPPGIAQSGEIDRATLLEAHGSVLENTSYRLTLSYRESRDGRPTGVHTETIRVANATWYTASVRQRGTFQAPVPALAETDVYANGTARFVRTDEGVDRGILVSYDRYLAGHTRFLSVFLDVTNSSIDDYREDNGTATAFVVTQGNQATLVEGTRGSFDVREDGLVPRARWSYGFASRLTGYGNLTATFRVRVSDIGSTTVDRPAWVDAYKTNATATPTSGNGTNASTSTDETVTPTDEVTPTPGNATG